MNADSPVRERKHGVSVQPWGVHAVTKDIPFGFSSSPFDIASCLTDRLHEGPDKGYPDLDKESTDGQSRILLRSEALAIK